VAPLLRALYRYRSIVQVDFVAKDNEWKVFWVSGRSLDEEFVSPAVEGFEGGGHCDVETEYAAVCASIKRHAQTLKALLTGSVPDLHGDEPVVNHDFFCEEVGADGRFVLVAEFLINILVHQRRFPHARIPQDNDFEQNFSS
jgi:hypothetical protein